MNKRTKAGPRNVYSRYYHNTFPAPQFLDYRMSRYACHPQHAFFGDRNMGSSYGRKQKNDIFSHFSCSELFRDEARTICE